MQKQNNININNKKKVYKIKKGPKPYYQQYSLQQFAEILKQYPHPTVCFFDTETTGLHKLERYNEEQQAMYHFNNYKETGDINTLNRLFPYILQLGFHIDDQMNKVPLYSASIILNPGENIEIEPGALKTHKISRERVNREGVEPQPVLESFASILQCASTIVAHNIEFDRMIVQTEFLRHNIPCNLYNINFGNNIENSVFFCTAKNPNIIRWAGMKMNKYKNNIGEQAIIRNISKNKIPKLTELYHICFGLNISGAHDALIDVLATRNCYYFLKDAYVI
jgi:DNA polymerase-3 subunit epsilon